MSATDLTYRNGRQPGREGINCGMVLVLAPEGTSSLDGRWLTTCLCGWVSDRSPGYGLAQLGWHEHRSRIERNFGLNDKVDHEAANRVRCEHVDGMSKCIRSEHAADAHVYQIAGAIRIDAAMKSETAEYQAWLIQLAIRQASERGDVFGTSGQDVKEVGE